jgi:heme/copper-type cytochrome/quinol oxidase subunit 1
MLVAGWVLLLRLSVGENIVKEGLVKLATDMLAMFVLPAPLLFVMYEAFSFEQTMAFTNAQFVLGVPVLIVAFSAISDLTKQTRTSGLPWNNAAFLAAMLAPPVFLAGGILGFFVDGADTRTPAHYHGMIAGVNLVLMGLYLTFILPLIDRPPQGARKIRIQLYLFGIGQFIACIGLFWAGGYGATRKTAGAAQGLVDGAMIGMALNGIGALIAVIGGIMFIWTVLSALGAKQNGA